MIVLQPDEVEARDRRARDIGLARLAIDRFGSACFQVLQESDEGLLRLVQNEVVDARDLLVARGRVGPARDHGDAGVVAVLDHRAQRFPLHDHGRREHHVGPVQVGVFEGGDVHVDDAQIVLRGKHRRDREQPERRERRLRAEQFQGVVDAPVGGRVVGVDQQGIAHG